MARIRKPEDPIKNREKSRRWRARNPEESRKRAKHYRDLHRQKRLDSADYLPGEACEICKRPFARFKYGPHWDHNHASGQFRGWLCGPCNQALGLFQDLPDNLLAAAEYLLKRGWAAG